MKYISILIVSSIFLSLSSCKKESYTDFDNPDRKKVIEDYNNIKRKNEVYAFSAENEGQLVNCDYGYVNAEVLQKVLTQLNYYRRFAGVSELTMDTAFNRQCQAVLKYFLSNKDSSRVSPAGKCYTPEALEGWNTMISSSSFFTNFESSVQHLMYQEGNEAVNRRWLLYPKLSKIGYGQLKSNFCFKVTGNGTDNSSLVMPESVAFPPKGYILKEMLPKTWMFVVPNADVRFSKVSLKMRDFYNKPKSGNKDLPMVDISIKVNNAGLSTHGAQGTLGEDPSILFEITDNRQINEKFEDEDLEYEVTIQNVLINGVPKDFTYKVYVIQKAS